MNAIAEFVGVTKTFAAKKGEVQALAPISFQLHADEFTTLLDIHAAKEEVGLFPRSTTRRSWTTRSSS